MERDALLLQKLEHLCWKLSHHLDRVHPRTALSYQPQRTSKNRMAGARELDNRGVKVSSTQKMPSVVGGGKKHSTSSFERWLEKSREWSTMPILYGCDQGVRCADFCESGKGADLVCTAAHCVSSFTHRQGRHYTLRQHDSRGNAS